MNYWLPEELWREIKLCLFHNIKIHGKHLKDDIYIKKFNLVMDSMPRKYMPRLGPRIVYGSVTKPFRYVKFIYKVCAPILIKRNIPIYKLIIELMPMGNLNQEEIKREYHKNISDFFVD